MSELLVWAASVASFVFFSPLVIFFVLLPFGLGQCLGVVEIGRSIFTDFFFFFDWI
jgi:hypothetical protein